jgi:chromate transport protein ChrA
VVNGSFIFHSRLSRHSQITANIHSHVNKQDLTPLSFEGSPWRLAVQRGLAPLVVGLMAAGMVAIARTAIVGFETTVLAVIVFAALYFGKKVNPALLIFGGGLCGWLFMR